MYSKEFMATLGQYVYGYLPNGQLFDPENEYLGKGVDKRCLDHVKEKGLNPENIWIVGRNLEKYAETTPAHEIASFAVEALMLATQKPKHNTASGRYQQDCWINTKLSDLYAEWQKTQINIYKEMNRFVSEYNLDDTLSSGWWSGSSFMLSAGRANSIEKYINVTPLVDGYENYVRFAFSNSKEMSKKERAKSWAIDNPDYDISFNDAGDTIDIKGLSINDALDLWSSQ